MGKWKTAKTNLTASEVAIAALWPQSSRVGRRVCQRPARSPRPIIGLGLISNGEAYVSPIRVAVAKNLSIPRVGLVPGSSIPFGSRSCHSRATRHNAVSNNPEKRPANVPFLEPLRAVNSLTNARLSIDNSATFSFYSFLKTKLNARRLTAMMNGEPGRVWRDSNCNSSGTILQTFTFNTGTE